MLAKATICTVAAVFFFAAFAGCTSTKLTLTDYETGDETKIVTSTDLTVTDFWFERQTPAGDTFIISVGDAANNASTANRSVGEAVSPGSQGAAAGAAEIIDEVTDLVNPVDAVSDALEAASVPAPVSGDESP